MKQALECLDEHLTTLAPFSSANLSTSNSSGESLLLTELLRAVTRQGGAGSSSIIDPSSDPILNAQKTPLLHSITAIHAYISMLVHVCRTSQTEIRQVSVSQWGSDVGLRVLSGLSSLYKTLMWETTVLIHSNAEMEDKVAKKATATPATASQTGTTTTDSQVEKVWYYFSNGTFNSY